MSEARLPTPTIVGLALTVPLLAYLTWAFVLALIVLAQGVPRESSASATDEAWLFDGVGTLGLIVVAVLFTVVGLLLSKGSEMRSFSPRLRRVVTSLMVVAVVLSFFMCGVVGAMGWHYFGCGNGYG